MVSGEEQILLRDIELKLAPFSERREYRYQSIIGRWFGADNRQKANGCTFTHVSCRGLIGDIFKVWASILATVTSLAYDNISVGINGFC